ncbi:MAG: hypothetical protein NC930_04035 [Candidatus Omnitrophica bacterium]|nr:hypothetical protein [Candidatus Omnitrophota bacterium]
MVWRKEKLQTKSRETEESAWCLILMKQRPELKDVIVRKIVEAFSVSDDFASQLVVRSPIVLVDNLTGPVASQIKAYFQDSGVDVRLTNDRSVKKRCYRIQWPEAAVLSFLEKFKSPILQTSEQMPEETEAGGTKESGETSGDSISSQDYLEKIKREFEQTFQEIPREQPEKPIPIHVMEMRHLEEKLSSVTAELSSATAELAGIRAELNQAQSALSESQAKVDHMSGELQTLTQSKEATEQSLMEAQRELKMLRKLTSMLESDKAELTKSLDEIRGHSQGAASELEEARAKIAVLTQECQLLKEAKAGLERSSEESRRELETAWKLKSGLEADKAELVKALAEAREQRRMAADELDECKAKLVGLTEGVRALVKMKEDFERTLQESQRELETARQKTNEFDKMKIELTRALVHAREQSMKLEDKCKLAWDYFDKTTKTLKEQLEIAKKEADGLRGTVPSGT